MPPVVRSKPGDKFGALQRRRRAARRGVPQDCKACSGRFRSRSRTHIYCTRKTCRRKRRLEYMRKYMAEWKKNHPDYWKTEKQREYLKRWRKEHPDYFRKYLAEWRRRNVAGSRTSSRSRANPPAARR
ncbi:MAG: hypothetical protein O6952_00590 [Planctomycetota bacterium]|nr:hypothetical protein [Planctomycetota bacterium]